MRRFLVVIATLLSIPAYAEGPDEIIMKQVFQDWEQNCVERQELRKCSINQQIRTQSGQVVAVVNGTVTENGTTIEFGLPLMMDLTTPVSIAVDEEQVSTLQYNACNNQACFILRTDDEVLLNNFRAGQIAVLTMRSYAGEEIQINISLSGFGAALEVLHAE
jgi:invasion protein IalB